MKYALIFSTALLIALGQLQPASAQPTPADLVKQSVEALGGADAMRALGSFIIKGEAKHWEPGQSFSANGESRFLGDSAFTLTSDHFVNRVDWDRDMKYPAVERVKYSEIISPSFGAVIDEKGDTKSMSGIRLAAQL